MPIPTPYTQSVPSAFDDDDDDEHDFFHDDFYRTHACKVLERSNVPFVVWFTDASTVYRHGHLGAGDTMAVLVRDLDGAAAVLQKYGWQDKPPTPPDVFPNERNRLMAHTMIDPQHVERRMYFPSWTAAGAVAFANLLGLGELSASVLRETENGDYSDTITLVLLLDSEWRFDVERHWRANGGSNARGRNKQQQQAIMVPRLEEYVDALITKRIELYDPDDEDNLDYLVPAHALTELYYFDHKSSTLPALRDPGFVDKLSPQNRQCHLDGLVGKTWKRGYEREAWEALQALKKKGCVVEGGK